MNHALLSLGAAALLAACLSAVADDEPPAEAPERPGPGPGTYTIDPDVDSIRIPFEIAGGEIRLHGHVNGKEARILIDNGSLWDQLLFFGSPKVDALELERDGEIEVGGAGSGDPIVADLAAGISLGFEGEDGRTIEFHDQEAVILPYEPGRPNPWAVAEGQVSSALFKHFVVGFDFDEGILTLVRPAAFDAAGRGTSIAMTPVAQGSWTVPGALTLPDGRRLELEMLMDLGWDEPLAINLGEAHAIEAPPGLEERALGIGAQGAIRGFLGPVPRLELGGLTFREPLATWSTAEDGGAKGAEVLVGLGIFRRLHVWFDYPNHRLLARPNRRFAEPFTQ